MRWYQLLSCLSADTHAAEEHTVLTPFFTLRSEYQELLASPAVLSVTILAQVQTFTGSLTGSLPTSGGWFVVRAM